MTNWVNYVNGPVLLLNPQSIMFFQTIPSVLNSYQLGTFWHWLLLLVLLVLLVRMMK